MNPDELTKQQIQEHPTEPRPSGSGGPLPDGRGSDETTESVAKKPCRRWRRWLFWSLLALSFLLALGGGFVGVMHWNIVKRLEHATAQLDTLDPGWRLEDIQAARTAIPDDENGALVVIAAAKVLPKKWPKPEADFFESGAAKQPNNIRLDSDFRRHMQAELETVNPARVEARKLAARSTGRYAIVYPANHVSVNLEQVQNARQVTYLLMLDALVEMEDAGNSAQAATSCRAAFNGGRSVGDEPDPIAQLVRLACVKMAVKTAERMLAQGQFNNEELASLQQVVEAEAKYPKLQIACRGERALFHRTWQAMENGDVSLEGSGNGPATWSERCYTFFGRDSLRRQHAQMFFPVSNKLVEISETPSYMRAKPSRELTTMLATSNSPMTLTVYSSMRLESSFMRCDAQLSCLAVAIAAERYRQIHTKWPQSLETLAPGYFEEIPLDPADGQSLRYLRLKDGVVVYSILADNDNHVFNPEEPTSGKGTAVRLWNVEQRGQAN